MGFNALPPPGSLAAGVVIPVALILATIAALACFVVIVGG